VLATPGKYRDPSAAADVARELKGLNDVTEIDEVKFPVARLKELIPRSVGAYPPACPFKGPRTDTDPVGSTVKAGRPLTLPISTVEGTTGATCARAADASVISLSVKARLYTAKV
jgi:hypothetical protein